MMTNNRGEIILTAVLDKKTKVKIKNLKKIAVIFAAVFIIALLFVNTEYIIEILPVSTVSEYTLSADETRQYIPFRNYILVCDRNGIAAVDKFGKEKWKVTEMLDIPIIAVSKNEIAAAATGGTEIFRIDKNGKYTSILTDNPIINLKLTDNGMLLSITDKKMYKGGVAVFDKKGNKLFNWWSGENRFIDASITTDKILAISSLVTENNAVQTEIAYFNLNKSSKKYTSDKFDGLINCIKWITDDKLIAVSENKVSVFDTNGKEKWSNDFGKNVINYYSVENKNNLVFVSSGGTYDKNMNVASFNVNGRLKGSFEYKNEIIKIKTNSGSIMFMSNDGITLINKNGKRLRTAEETGIPYDACLFRKGNRVFADCGNTARLFYCNKAVHMGDKNDT